MTTSPSFEKFMRFARALASPDALVLAAQAPDPIAARLQLMAPVVDNPRLRELDRPRTLLSGGPRR